MSKENQKITKSKKSKKEGLKSSLLQSFHHCLTMFDGKSNFIATDLLKQQTAYATMIEDMKTYIFAILDVALDEVNFEIYGSGMKEDDLEFGSYDFRTNTINIFKNLCQCTKPGEQVVLRAIQYFATLTHELMHYLDFKEAGSNDSMREWSCGVREGILQLRKFFPEKNKQYTSIAKSIYILAREENLARNAAKICTTGFIDEYEKFASSACENDKKGQKELKKRISMMKKVVNNNAEYATKTKIEEARKIKLKYAEECRKDIYDFSEKLLKGEVVCSDLEAQDINLVLVDIDLYDQEALENFYKYAQKKNNKTWQEACLSIKKDRKVLVEKRQNLAKEL